MPSVKKRCDLGRSRRGRLNTRTRPTSPMNPPSTYAIGAMKLQIGTDKSSGKRSGTASWTENTETQNNEYKTPKSHSAASGTKQIRATSHRTNAAQSYERIGVPFPLPSLPDPSQGGRHQRQI